MVRLNCSISCRPGVGGPSPPNLFTIHSNDRPAALSAGARVGKREPGRGADPLAGCPGRAECCPERSPARSALRLPAPGWRVTRKGAPLRRGDQPCCPSYGCTNPSPVGVLFATQPLWVHGYDIVMPYVPGLPAVAASGVWAGELFSLQTGLCPQAPRYKHTFGGRSWKKTRPTKAAASGKRRLSGCRPCAGCPRNGRGTPRSVFYHSHPIPTRSSDSTSRKSEK